MSCEHVIRQPCAGAHPCASASPVPPRDAAADAASPYNDEHRTTTDPSDPQMTHRTRHTATSTERHAAGSAQDVRHATDVSAPRSMSCTTNANRSSASGSGETPRTAENSLHRLQCRPFGGYRVTHENATPRSVTTIRKFPAVSWRGVAVSEFLLTARTMPWGLARLGKAPQPGPAARPVAVPVSASPTGSE